nr:ThiF family adenylyltransferase [Jeotgalicoccus sp. WY2]
MDNRYSRQLLYSNIGERGQGLLGEKTAVIVGLGALGSLSSEMLARAGVGKLILIDRDYVELTNLQRQTLYNEEDAELKKPKAVAAYDIIENQQQHRYRSARRTLRCWIN